MTEINRLTEDLDRERHINYLLKSGYENGRVLFIVTYPTSKQNYVLFFNFIYQDSFEVSLVEPGRRNFKAFHVIFVKKYVYLVK